MVNEAGCPAQFAAAPSKKKTSSRSLINSCHVDVREHVDVVTIHWKRRIRITSRASDASESRTDDLGPSPCENCKIFEWSNIVSFMRTKR